MSVGCHVEFIGLTIGNADSRPTVLVSSLRSWLAVANGIKWESMKIFFKIIYFQHNLQVHICRPDFTPKLRLISASHSTSPLGWQIGFSKNSSPPSKKTQLMLSLLLDKLQVHHLNKKIWESFSMPFPSFTFHIWSVTICPWLNLQHVCRIWSPLTSTATSQVQYVIFSSLDYCNHLLSSPCFFLCPLEPTSDESGQSDQSLPCSQPSTTPI